MGARLGPSRGVSLVSWARRRQRRAGLRGLAAPSGEVMVVVFGALSGLLYLATYDAEHRLVHDRDAGRQLVELARYDLAVIGLVGLYAGLLASCRRGRLRSPRARRLAILIPVLFNLAWLASAPLMSTDVYSYLAYGYIGTLPGGNPYAQEASTIVGTPFGLQLADRGWDGAGLSPYGPVWNELELGIVSLTSDASLALVLSKATVATASLGAAAMVASILARVRPDGQQLGTLAYLWNPLLILLLAGEGHNDGVMILLVLTALALSVRAHVTAGVLAQLLAVLTKFLPLLLLPLQVTYWWRTTADRPGLLGRLMASGVLGLALAALLYQPVWLGAATFVGTGALGDGRQHPVDPPRLVSVLGRGAVVGLAVLIGARRARDPQRLLECCAGVVFVAVLAGPQPYWPWYAATPVALMVLTPRGQWFWPMLGLSACALVASPLGVLEGRGVVTDDARVWAMRVLRELPLLCAVGLWLAGKRGVAFRTQLRAALG